MPPPPTPYRIDFAPQAWRQIGLMEHATFTALREALDSIAQDMRRKADPSESAENQQRMTVAGLVVTYECNDAKKTITIVEIRPISSQP